MPQRPKTAPTARGPGITVDSTANDLFSGGNLKVSIFKADKIVGPSKIVFGHDGAYSSRVQIYSLDNLLTESIVNHGGVDEDFKWAGYEDDFKAVSITESPIVRLVLYACDRPVERQPLGLALLSLQDIPQTDEDTYMVTLPIQTRSDIASFDPTELSTVGSITLRVMYFPYRVVSLEQFTDHVVDVSFMKAIRFGFGWHSSSSSVNINDGSFVASLVMFDRDGKFIDAVDDLHARTKCGPRAVHRRVVGKNSDAYADVEGIQVVLNKNEALKQSRVHSYFVIITARNANESLNNLSGMYFRIINANNNRENCRFTVSVDETCSACIMARIVKDKDNPEKWIVRAYGQLGFCERSYGTLVPEMRDLLGDVVPNCKGTSRDIISYASIDRWIELNPLLQTNLSTAMPEQENNSDDDRGNGPQNVTAVSLGINWIQEIDGSVDIDVGCLMLDSEKSIVDYVSLEKPRSSCSSISQSSPDEDEEGVDISTLDNKVVQISLADIPETVIIVAFYVYNPSIGGKLSGIGCLSGHLFETESKRKVTMLDCPDNTGYRTSPSLLLGMLYKKEGNWYFINSCKRSEVAELIDNSAGLEDYLNTSGILERA